LNTTGWDVDDEKAGGAMFPTKILLATDGSAGAEQAAWMAKTVSEKLDSELHVVYVAPMPDPGAWPEATLYDRNLLLQTRERAESEGREVLDRERYKLGAMGAEIADSHLRVGRPDSEIVRLAEQLGSGLVIAGSRGLGPVRRAVMGSVSGSALRHAHCPVMVVRGKTGDEDAAVGPIVLAVDGSEEAKQATKAAAELSGGTGSEVHLVSVLPEPESMYGPHFYSTDVEERLLERVDAESRAFLDKQAEAVRSGGGSPAQTYLAKGQPDAEIVKLAEEIGAGLIVMGSRGLGGVRRALMGSVSDSVVRHAHCPVLVVRGSKDRDTKGGPGAEKRAGARAPGVEA
jgi:nucleotide-binding universal stress UspA family protein